MDCDNTIYECKLRGILKRHDKKNNCVVGDMVIISDDNAIIEIEKRKNLLERPLVSNIDYFIIQFAAKDPDIDFERLNLLLTRSFYYKIKPIVVVNKIDLLDRKEIDILKEKLEFLKAIAIKLFLISTKNEIGIEELKLTIKNKISAFGGPSGVGKSSLINRMQTKMVLETGTTSKRLRKGKHTTKDTNLLPLCEGGYIVDTPGFSSVELPNIPDAYSLISLFPEFHGHEHCKFHNCNHMNEPNCEIKEFVENGKINKERYEFYKKTYEKLKNERWNRYD